MGVLLELYDMLSHILEDGGAESRVAEVKARCDYFRSKIEKLPVRLPHFPLSNAISPVRFEKDIALDFFNYLKNEKNIMVNPVGGELGKCSIRVAHIGDLQMADYDMLVEEMRHYFNM